VLGGAVFGDQCSPISDTTILSALACGGDVMDHVTTQLPLALAAAAIGGAASTLLALLA
jgi:Na+/H+ antiporter NhaC